jgi:hypothetical protein
MEWSLGNGRRGAARCSQNKVLAACAVDINQFYAAKAVCAQNAQRSFLMKTKRFFLFGLLAVLLALGLVLAGCGDDDDDGGGATATISGEAKVGETLTAEFSGFTADSIYWKSASSETGAGDTIDYGKNTHDILSYEVGNYIWVEASNDDHSVNAVSARVGPVAAAN